jgi:class 3 adenylate cyclase/tetratricopeptide (TPR) repeat protein
MELAYLVVAIAGVIATVVFGFLQVIIPLIRGDVKFSKKFPFIISTRDIPKKESTTRKEPMEAAKEVRGKRRTVMFIDIKGFVGLRLEDESRAHKIVKEYRKIVCPEFSKYKGRQLKAKDDEFLVQFADTLDAASCAIEIQKIFNTRNSASPEEQGIKVRIGIHEGPVAKRKEDVLGSAEEIASIIGTHAKADDIHVTESVYQRIRYKIEAPIRELDRSELKDVSVPMGVYSIILPWRGPQYSATEKEEIGRIKVAVVDFFNETGEKALDGLSGMFITALEQSRHLSVLTRSGMLDVLKQMGSEEVGHIDESLGREIGRKANLNALAIASVRKFGEIYNADVKVLNPQKDEYLFTASAEGRGQECIPQVIDTISRKTRLGLEEKLSEIQVSSKKVADITTLNLEAYQHYFHGEECINKLKFKQAQEELKKAVALDPTFGLAYYRLAYAVDWERRGPEATEYIEKAIALLERIPEKEKYLVRAMNVNLEKGREAGVEVLKEMESIYSNDKEMLYNIGDWSFHLRKYETAREYLERVLLMDPIHDRALQHLTWTYRSMAAYDKMLESAKRYEIATGSEESYVLIAQAYALQGDFKTGLDTLEQFRRIYPQRHCITNAIIDLYAFNEQYDKALSELAALGNENQPLEVDYYGRHIHTRFLPYVGKYRETIAALDKAIERCVHVDDIALAGFLHIVKGMYFVDGWYDVARAWGEVEKTFAADVQMRTHTLYWGVLVYLYVAHGDYALAENAARKTGWNMWSLMAKALIHAQKNECEKAETLADSLLDRTPGDLRIYLLYRIGECLLESGQLDKAEQFLLESQKVYSNEYGYRAIFYPKSFYLLGKLYEAKKNRAAAVKNYEKLLEMWKDADEDLPDLIDAKKRLARLRKKETGTSA